MAKNIEFEVKGSIDCSKLTDAERTAVVGRLHAENDAGALTKLITDDIAAANPALVSKWVGMTSKLHTN